MVLIVHGRSGNMSGRAAVARRLGADGFGVLLFDYRGYGASGGSPSERGIGDDALRAYDLLRAAGIGPERILVVGQSLGNAPAAALAAQRQIAGLVLVSPFTNLPEATAERLPWLPIALVPWPRNRFEVAGQLRGLDLPITLVASRGDRLVPFANAQRLSGQLRRRPRWIGRDASPHDGLLAEVTASGELSRLLGEMRR